MPAATSAPRALDPRRLVPGVEYFWPWAKRGERVWLGRPWRVLVVEPSPTPFKLSATAFVLRQLALQLGAGRVAMSAPVLRDPLMLCRRLVVTSSGIDMRPLAIVGHAHEYRGWPTVSARDSATALDHYGR